MRFKKVQGVIEGRSVSDAIVKAMDWLNDDTWVISDTHWWHDNIIAYCGRPSDHDYRMVSFWNGLVQPDEHVLHLGDVMWWTKSAEPLPVLYGNVHLIPGNHDHSRQLREFRALGWEILPDPLVYGDVAFSHRPLEKGPWPINIHGHVHNDSDWDAKLISDREREYVNVSVEVMGYRPVRLREILSGTVGDRRTATCVAA